MQDATLLNLNFIAQIIYDKKGRNILALDIKEFSTFTDYMLIAEGDVDRHVKAIAQEVIDRMKKEKNITPYHVEGLESGDWIVIDYIELIIHLFMPGLRDKYQLEELWSDGKIVELDIKVEMGERI